MSAAARRHWEGMPPSGGQVPRRKEFNELAKAVLGIIIGLVAVRLLSSGAVAGWWFAAAVVVLVVAAWMIAGAAVSIVEAQTGGEGRSTEWSDGNE